MRSRKGIALLILIVAAVLFLFFWRSPAKGLRKTTLQYQDRERTYYVHTPAGVPTGKRLPVVLAFHGRLGTGQGMAKLTHLNLNDGTSEGLSVREKFLFTVQYHPESSPGPHDSDYLFRDFARMMDDFKGR